MPFDGPIVPFGAMVEYHPISAKEQKYCQVSFSFMHYTRKESGTETLRSQTFEELEEMDASELHARRLNAKEVLTPQRSGIFIFPVAGGTVNNLWVRTASENINLNPGASGTRRTTRNSSRKVR